MTQYQPPYPPHPGPHGGPGAPQPQPQPQGPRRFPFVAGYLLWFMPSLWRDAGRRWRGVGFFYLLLLLLITWAAVFAKGYGSLKQGVQTELPKFSSQVPNIDIKDGVVTTDAPEPY